VGGSLGVLLKASRVRSLSRGVAIFLCGWNNNGWGRAERGGSLPPYILHSSRDFVILI
jgi:hypothetical protein